MTGKIDIPTFVILNLSLAATLQAASPCREEICLRANNMLDDVDAASEFNGANETLHEFPPTVRSNEVTDLSPCQCGSEISCMKKCCSLESALDRKTGKCTEGNISETAGYVLMGTSKNILPSDASPGTSCFGNCPAGKLLVFSLEKDSYSPLRLESGQFCAYEGNISFCAGPDEFCLDYLSSPRGLAVVACRNILNSTKPSWKGYHYPSPLMPLMIGVMLIISSLSLSLTFLVYSCFRELRNLHGKCLLCHMGSLIVYYVVIVVRRFRPVEMRHNGISCFALDVARYYFYLAPFSWLNVTCFDISTSFINLRPRHGNSNKTERTRFVLYSLYAWVTPVAAFLLSFHVDLHSKGLDFSHINVNRWCKEKHFSSSYYRYIPMSLYMVLSVLLFIMTAIKIYQINHSTSILRSGENSLRKVAEESKKKRFQLYTKLLVVMGFMSWVMEPIFWTVHEWMVTDRTDFRSTVWFVMLVIRNLQGLYISVVFLWNDKVRLLAKKMLLKMSGVAPSTSGSRSHEMSSLSHPESSTQIVAALPRNSSISVSNG